MEKLPSYIANNETYRDLHEDIEDLKEWLANHEPENPKYALKAEKLQEKEQKLEKLEQSLRETAELISRLQESPVSERLKSAIELFNSGDSNGASAILDFNDIERDASKNIEMILNANIEELKLSIQILLKQKPEGWKDKLKENGETLVSCVKVIPEKSSDMADFFREITLLLFQERESCTAMWAAIKETNLREKEGDPIILAESLLYQSLIYEDLGIISYAIEKINEAKELVPSEHKLLERINKQINTLSRYNK